MKNKLKKYIYLIPIGTVLIIAIFFLNIQKPLASDSDIKKLQKSIQQRKIEIENLDRLIATSEQQSSTSDLRMNQIHQNIAETYNKLLVAEEELENQQYVFDQRLRDRYKFNEDDFIFVLLGARDFFDFLSRASYTVRIIQQDNEILNVLIKKKEDIKYIQENLQIQKDWELSVKQDMKQRVLQAKRDIFREKKKLADEEKRLAQLIAENQLNTALTPTPYNPATNSVLTDVKAVKAQVEPYKDVMIYTGEKMPISYKSTGVSFSGVASWYGNEFHGRTTANGEVYNQFGFTCASRTLPFNTFLLITFKDKRIVVRVNDRGPYIPGRILDLTRKGADTLGFSGIANVNAEVVKPVN